MGERRHRHEHRSFGSRPDQPGFFDAGHVGSAECRGLARGGRAGLNEASLTAGDAHLRTFRYGLTRPHAVVGLERFTKNRAVGRTACSGCTSLDHARVAPARVAGVHRRNCFSDATADVWLVSVRWPFHRADTGSRRIGNSRNLPNMVLGRCRNLRRLFGVLRVDDRFRCHGLTAFLPPGHSQNSIPMRIPRSSRWPFPIGNSLACIPPDKCYDRGMASTMRPFSKPLASAGVVCRAR